MENSYVGKNSTRVDAYGKVTGKAIYSGDFHMHRELHTQSVYVPRPHCRILEVKTDRALAMPGVVAIALARDVPGNNTMFGRYPVFVNLEGLYTGDVVATVAAETYQEAKAAANAVEILYEALPGVWNLREALAEGAAAVHSDVVDNEIEHAYYPLRKGDAETGLATAAKVIERTYEVGFQDQAYLEPESMLVAPAPFHQGYEVYGSIQNPYTIRANVATVMGIPESQVRVVLTVVGGSFGGKDESVMSMAARCAVLARMTGRPVRMDLTRENSFRESSKRHPFILDYRVGITAQGVISAIQTHLVCQGGAYNNKARFSNWRASVHSAGPYRIEHIKADVHGKYTNTIFGGAFRGFSAPQVLFGIETLMDELAYEAGMNPKDFRLLNVLREGDTIACGQLLKEGTIAAPLTAMIHQVAQKADFDRKWQAFNEQNLHSRSFKKGLGLSITYRGAGLGGEGNDSSSAMITVCRDGSIQLFSGHTEMGQGMRTAHMQIAAEALGVDIARIDYRHSDTSITLDAGPTVASRGTQSGGRAVLQAAAKLKVELLEAGARKTGLPTQQLDIVNDLLVSKDGSVNCPFKELVAYAVYPVGADLSAQGWYSPGLTHIDPATQQGDCYQTYTYGVAIAEVTVDEATGKVIVDKVYLGYELGRAINPELAYGQLVGGMLQGLGYALFEEIAERKGELMTTNFDEYLIPTTMDVPEVDLTIFESRNPEGPYGAKGIGELGIELIAPAVGNAMYHATGRRLRELPFNLERVRIGRSLTR